MGLISSKNGKQLIKEGSKLPELSKETIGDFLDKRKMHLKKANDLVLKLETGIANRDTEDVLKIMYHKVIANVLLPEKRIGALEYLCCQKGTEDDDFENRRIIMERINGKLVDISNFPMDPTYNDILSFCKDDAILYWFESKPHCWNVESSFWSVRDVVGNMNNIIKLKENNYLEDGHSENLSDRMKFGKFPIILEQVI